MKRATSDVALGPGAPERLFFGATLFLLTLTGFAQMPIFKRYHIADIPGLGWLDRYLVTHYLHYLGAAIFIGFIAYFAAAYLLEWRGSMRPTRLGYAVGGILLALLVTGLFLVFRNLSGAPFSPGLIVAMSLAHLGLVVLLLLAAIGGATLNINWVTPRSKGQHNA
jgi:hypothetical protein